MATNTVDFSDLGAQPVQATGSGSSVDFSDLGAQPLPTPGQQTNDVGESVIVPQPGESFADTMQRAATHGQTLNQSDLNKEEGTIPAKAAMALGAAAGPAVLSEGAGALYDMAIKHLAGSVLPGMEQQAAMAKLAEWAPKVAKAAAVLGVRGAELGLLWKAVSGSR